MKILELKTESLEELVDITDEVEAYVKESGVKNGSLIVQTITNTCAVVSLSSQFGPVDKNFFAIITKLYPLMDGMQFMGHEIKCIRSGLIGSSKSFIVADGKPVLGPFEKIYTADFSGPTDKIVVVLLASEVDLNLSEENNPAVYVEQFRQDYIKAEEEKKKEEARIVQEMREEWAREHANDERFKKKEEKEDKTDE